MTGTAVIVDDNPEVGMQLAGILARLGLTVSAICENGIAGIQAITVARPTIAMIDIQMAGIGGLDVVKAVRSKVTSKLVVCSGTKQQQVQDQALAVGADLFVVKPFDQVLLARELATLLGG